MNCFLRIIYVELVCSVLEPRSGMIMCIISKNLGLHVHVSVAQVVADSVVEATIMTCLQ